jgi:phosphoribosylformimino-5-aminoimidazole carboxamide ribotide isomerase
MRIIMAIDIINGKCVRLTKGDFDTKKIYNENPLEVAKEIEDNGISYLHLIDLDGAKNKKIVNYKVLEQIANKTGLNIDFGGGIRSNADLQVAFNCGASQITGGSLATTNPELFTEWLTQYGSKKIILGADCKNRKISTNGWRDDSQTDVIDYITEYKNKGAEYIICTDIEKDGTLQGPSADLYKDVLKIDGIKLIASGGISSIDDIMEMNTIGCEGTIIGKAVYEGKITLKELGRLC